MAYNLWIETCSHRKLNFLSFAFLKVWGRVVPKCIYKQDFISNFFLFCEKIDKCCYTKIVLARDFIQHSVPNFFAESGLWRHGPKPQMTKPTNKHLRTIKLLADSANIFPSNNVGIPLQNWAEFSFEDSATLYCIFFCWGFCDEPDKVKRPFLVPYFSCLLVSLNGAFTSRCR